MKSQALKVLADHTLLAQLSEIVSRDCATTAEMLALVGEVQRRRLFADEGYESMYAYCVQELHMSGEVAYKRIQAARAARKFPAVLGHIASGRLHLTAVVLLAPKLTRENAGELLAAAAHRTKRQVLDLLAERFPQPDLPASITPLPESVPPKQLDPDPVGRFVFAASSEAQLVPESVGMLAGTPSPTECTPPPSPVHPVAPPSRVVPLAPRRFGLQVTFGQEAHEDLLYLQALLGHAVPTGNLAEVLGRALKAAIREVEREKFGKTSRTRPSASSGTPNTRHIPTSVRRKVVARDGVRCSFVSDSGHHCESRTRLEFDHILPVAKGGESSEDNLRLRCRTHNQLAAREAFGAGLMERKRQAARRGVVDRQQAARAREAERERREAKTRELEANATARARAEEVIPWLREL